MKDILVDERYRLNRKIGEGGFGLVYLGNDIESGEEVALKLSHIHDDPTPLEREAEIYKELSGAVGIPKVHWFGEECDYHVLVQDILGPSLEDLRNYCGERLSLKTVLLITDQAISRLEYIHSKGILHRDIKPENFLMGVGKQGNTLYLIDFGVAEEFEVAERLQNLEDRPFGGTARYASISNHKGHGEQSWGDDLESLGYVFVFLAAGRLPWQGIKAVDEDERNGLIMAKKMKLSGKEICEGILPDEFAQFIDYARGLEFKDKPDYAYLRQLFRGLAQSKGFEYDNVFDWTVRRYLELHGKEEAGP